MVLKIAMDELEATHAAGASNEWGSMRIAPPLNRKNLTLIKIRTYMREWNHNAEIHGDKRI